jgi:4-amino-4-deoxy-L-arabinose transferase-like glycosyltransferase
VKYSFWIGWQGWLALALLSFSCHLAFQGTRGVDNSSEGRYAECAREMAASGDYITPTLNGVPHWTKPPLSYWTTALGLKIFGVNGWGARFGNALAGALTVLFIAGAGAALWDEAVGLAAGWIYLSSPFPFIGAFALTADTLLTCCVAAALWCYAAARRAPGRLGWVLGFWLACGLGFMTKGPLVFLPLVALVIWHARTGRPCRLFHPAGLAVFALSGFWWFAVIFLKHPELLGYYVNEEIAGRVAGSVGNETTHNRQWYKAITIYFPVLTVGAGAWLWYAGGVFVSRDLWKPRAVWRAMASTGAGRDAAPVAAAAAGGVLRRKEPPAPVCAPTVPGGSAGLRRGTRAPARRGLSRAPRTDDCAGHVGGPRIGKGLFRPHAAHGEHGTGL